MPRSYDMTMRARRAAETSERIAAVAEHLFASNPIGEVTLDAIAAEADVSVQTVLRHYDSRDGCIEAVRDRVLKRIDKQRGQTPPGDVDAALSGLLLHYEAEGPLILNLLARETVDPVAGKAVQEGRTYHRNWVKRCFGPHLNTPDSTIIDALVAATDIYVWKLLRRDLNRSKTETLHVMSRLVEALLKPT